MVASRNGVLPHGGNPLTRPAPAAENAGGGPPSPPRGRGLECGHRNDWRFEEITFRTPPPRGDRTLRPVIVALTCLDVERHKVEVTILDILRANPQQ
jgi:hypothetical protein